MARAIMMEGIPNESYHKEFPDYISSTTLKKYRVSPLHFKHEQEEDEADYGIGVEKQLGSLWHDTIASKHPSGNFDLSNYVVFQPKINEKTGKPYGETTDAQMSYRLSFISENQGKTVVSQTQWDTAAIMADNIFANPDHPSYDYFIKAFNGGKPETSYFIDDFYEGVNIRIRPDLDLPKAIFDYKSFGYTIEEFPRKITELGYDISAAMYVEGKKEYYRRNGMDVPEIRFYWIVQESNPPYDWAIFSAEHFMESGADKFYACLVRHKHSLDTKQYYGIASTIVSDSNKYGIFRPEPTPWQKQLNKLL